MREHKVHTKPESWAKRGFLPEEQYFLSEISKAGAQAPYIQAMSRKRISLNANRVKYKWTKADYRRRIVAEYVRMGLRDKGKRESFKHYFNDLFWYYFEAWKNITPFDPEWETPKRKRKFWKEKGETKAQTTRRKQRVQRIKDYDQSIIRATVRGDQKERHRLEVARNRVQNELDIMKYEVGK